MRNGVILNELLPYKYFKSFRMLLIICVSEEWLITPLSGSSGSLLSASACLDFSAPSSHDGFLIQGSVTVWVNSSSTPRFSSSIWFPFCSDTLVGQKQMVGQTQSFVRLSFSVRLLSPQAVTSSTGAAPHTLFLFSFVILILDLFFGPSQCVRFAEWLKRQCRLKVENWQL